MSTNFMRICTILIEDNFGVTVKQVAEALISFGPIRLSGIVAHSKVSKADVKEALKILFQHNLLAFKLNDGFADPFYSLRSEEVLTIPRVPQFLARVESRLGPECHKVVDEVIKAGQVTMSKLYYILGYKFKKANPEASDDALFERLHSYRNAMRRVVERKYICICPTNLSNPSSSVPDYKLNEPIAFVIPSLDIRQLCEKILATDSNLENFPDSAIFWRINVPEFQTELVNELIIEAVRAKHHKFVDINIFRGLIELGTKDLMFPFVSTPVSTVEVLAYLTKTQKVPPTIEKVKEQLEILEIDPLMIIKKENNVSYGTFVVNVKNTYNNLVWATIEQVIQQKHGYFAARIFRIIKQHKYVEQEKINEIGMIPGKNSKDLTYRLLEDSFIRLKEIRKSYAVSAAGHSSSFVFYLDFPQIIQTVMESCYKGMVNIRLRMRTEREKYTRLVSKEERIERILTNMISNKCTEEQLQEVRELITPPERTLLNKYKGIANKLASGHLHLDHTLFVMQMYLHFASLK